LKRHPLLEDRASRRPSRSFRRSTEAPRPFRPPDWEWARHGEIGWWVRPEWRGSLLTDDGRLRLEEWRTQGRVHLVKSGPHRVVYRVESPDGAFFVKQFLVPSWREVLRQWFRRGKGRNEAKRALRLAQFGVPTITPIALGERRVRQFLFENILISPEIQDSIPLDRFLEQELPKWEPRQAAAFRARIAEALGTLTARLHRAGLYHDDFHPGNVLVRVDGDQPRLALIDLDALRSRCRLSPRRALTNLARLNHSFWHRASRVSRLTFLKAYLDHMEVPSSELERFAATIDRMTRRWAERLWKRWGRRCVGRNKYFERYRRPGRWAIASRDLDPADVARLLEDPDAPFRDPEAVTLKQSRTTTVVEQTRSVQGRPTPIIYKRFNHKKKFECIWTLVRPSRAWRAWRAGGHLASRGLPTPQNLCVIGRSEPHWFSRFLNVPVVTYLMTRKLEPSVTLGDYARGVLPKLDPTASRRAKRRLIEALARLIRELHERSLSDRDLKVSNILIEGDPAAERPRLSLIDLVGVRLAFPLPKHRRLQNLTRLTASLEELPGWTRTDSLRFLIAYLPRSERRDGRWKVTAWAIARGLERKRFRNQRLGRPLS